MVGQVNKHSGEMVSTQKGILKPYHHLKIDSEFKLDCEVWKTFLTHFTEVALWRPIVDFSSSVTAEQLFFYSDANAAKQKV